ncbi:hypothetical protein MSG28_000681 [Choristoneura fumiferana]|uniref:Uncharacterized protein n=1 Tax=Choristoneura fumiferana TaxID=7141 RepID=A0ACC0K1Z6_CHOFU|nr:hypothetical protein MSG28_000681 [Choristoneura fumiferana]
MFFILLFLCVALIAILKYNGRNRDYWKKRGVNIQIEGTNWKFLLERCARDFAQLMEENVKFREKPFNALYTFNIRYRRIIIRHRHGAEYNGLPVHGYGLEVA